MSDVTFSFPVVHGGCLSCKDRFKCLTSNKDAILRGSQLIINFDWVVGFGCFSFVPEDKVCLVNLEAIDEKKMRLTAIYLP